MSTQKNGGKKFSKSSKSDFDKNMMTSKVKLRSKNDTSNYK